MSYTIELDADDVVCKYEGDIVAIFRGFTSKYYSEEMKKNNPHLQIEKVKENVELMQNQKKEGSEL